MASADLKTNLEVRQRDLDTAQDLRTKASGELNVSLRKSDPANLVLSQEQGYTRVF